MKINYTNISERAINKGCDISRMEYLHILLRCFEFDVDEVKDSVNFDYNLQKYEKTSDFATVKELLQPLIDKKLKECGYSKTKLLNGEIERVDWDGEGLTAERARRDIMTLYNSLMSADKTKWNKDEIDKTLKIIKEYDEKFGIFNEEYTEKNRFDSHFYEVFRSFNAVCSNCNNEIDITRGLLIKCRHCGVYIDCRETKKDYEEKKEAISGEVGKNNIEVKDDKETVIYYDNHYDNLQT